VNYENALLTDTPGVVGAYGKEFDRLWERASEVDPGSAGMRMERPTSGMFRNKGTKLHFSTKSTIPAQKKPHRKKKKPKGA